MKKVLVCVLVLSFCAAFSGSAMAADKKKGKEGVAPALTEAQRGAIEARALEQLDAQSWTIYLTMQGAKKPRVETDLLTFTADSVTSQNLLAKGYTGSNISLTAQEDGTTVFETVQRTEDGSMAMWRGRLSGNKLTGIVNMRSKEGQSDIYSFTTIMPVVSNEPEPMETGAEKKKR